MEWPARSSDLNPIEHLWDYLGREVAALNPPPRSLHELKQGLLCVWSSLPIPMSDNLINSMGNRCRQCIQSSSSDLTFLSSLRARPPTADTMTSAIQLGIGLDPSSASFFSKVPILMNYLLLCRTHLFQYV
ncbi:DDE_3 domain-containing protein [Trichonephila clavipes]|nr:DDE_3 domain-containing protein [Trichonephila clavipes]